MQIRYAIGAERKKLVAAAAAHLGTTTTYAGMPSASYIVGEYTITRESALLGPDDPNLVEVLAAQGFQPIEEAYDAQPMQPDRLTIEVPVCEGFSTEKLANLEKLIASRATLLKKVLSAEALPIKQADGILRFPWFPADDNAMVYGQLACALVRTAMEATRITARERPCESERFHMRTYLLKIGFIGPEYAKARKILTQGLSGSGSYAKADPR